MSWKHPWEEKITMDDWFENNTKIEKESVKLKESSFCQRQESKKISGNAQIETDWSLVDNNRKLENRYKEILKWKEEFSNYAIVVKYEIDQINAEKLLTQQELDRLINNFTAVNDCLVLRSKRKPANMCIDSVEENLNTEVNMLEKVKRRLIDSCEEAERQINILFNMSKEIESDIELKEQSLRVDEETLNYAIPPYINVGYETCEDDISLKFISYESWIENCCSIKRRTDVEICNSKKLCGEMCLPRKQAHNEIESQYEKTNYAFRRRIHEYQTSLEELHWQKQNLEQEKECLFLEINSLEDALENEKTALNVAKAQYSNYLRKPETELCLDECTFTLEDQVLKFESIKQELLNKLDSVKKIFCEVRSQIFDIEQKINDKRNDLTIDVRCLDIRKGLLLP